MELFMCARRGDLEGCRRLLQQGVNPNQFFTMDVMSPLEIAMENRRYDCMECLLEYGADPNIHTSYGFSLIHITVCHGDQRSIEILVSHGADLNNKDHHDGWRPLHEAIGRQPRDVIIFL